MGTLPMKRIHEYASHEGDYGLDNIVRAGRAEDVRASFFHSVDDADD